MKSTIPTTMYTLYDIHYVKSIPNLKKMEKYYNFEHAPDKLPPQCGIGWLLEPCDTVYQNLLDYYSFQYRRIPQIAHNTLYDLCNAGIQADFKKLLIFKQGILLDDFVENTEQYWNTEYKDCVVVGNEHALYIDLEWWYTFNKPDTFDKIIKIAPNVGTWNTKLSNGMSYKNICDVGKTLWATRWYASNTETMDAERKQHRTSSVFSTSGGISPISNAYTQNLKPGGTLLCYDTDVLALSMQSYIFDKWDGRYWKMFVEDYINEHPVQAEHFTCVSDLPNTDAYLDKLGEPFVEWWNTVAKTFNVKYVNTDLINVNQVIEDLDDEVGQGQDFEKVFIDISNAFNYEINSMLYSKNVRIEVERKYIKYFNRYKDKFIKKGFDLEIMNLDKRYPHLPKLFPWQKF